MKTLLAALVGIAVGFFCHSQISSAFTFNAPDPIASTASPLPVKAQPPKSNWQRSDLAILHGRVIGASEGAAVVESTGPDYGGLDQIRLPATAGAADSARLAKLAINTDEQKYGRLMTWETGTLTTAAWTPQRTATGRVRVKDLHRNSGETVNMIVAPLSGDLYTVTYKVPPLSPSVWMWSGKGSMLDRQTRK